MKNEKGVAGTGFEPATEDYETPEITVSLTRNFLETYRPFDCVSLTDKRPLVPRYKKNQ